MTTLHHKNTQYGLATLAVVLILLFSVSLIAIYAAKQGILEQRVSGNDVRYRDAFARAEAGLDDAIAHFKETGTVPGSGICTPAAGAFCSWHTTLTVGSKTVHVFNAAGTSDDGTGHATVQKQVAFDTLVNPGAPASPIIADGAMGSGGNFNVVVNPNAAGNGIPVSIWTHGAATLGSSSSTCQPQYMSGHACPNAGSGAAGILSQQGSIGLDVVQNAVKVSAGGTFPDDVFEYLFGVSSLKYEGKRAEAEEAGHLLTASDCDTLNTNSKGLYWIEGGGNCDVGNAGRADDTGTTAFDPNVVILVLDETELRVSANSEIYGYVMAFDHPGNVTGGQDIRFGGGAKIFGSFLSNYDMGTHLNGTMGIVWTDYSAVLDDPDSSAYGTLGVIPGSWRDF